MTLTELYKAHTGKATVKYEHYLDTYERYFRPFVGRAPKVVEVGIADGGSLEVWSKYFGPGAQVIGVDLVDRTNLKLDGNIEIRIGDQSNDEWLTEFSEKIGAIDIFIDDGSHIPADQWNTFQRLFHNIRPGGLYIVEDMKLEAARMFERVLDDMYAWDGNTRSYFTRTIRSVSSTFQLVIIEKGDMDKELHSPLFRGGQHVQP